MQNSKPFVQAACLCDNVLMDKDGVMSAIRIIDTYYIDPPELKPGEVHVIELQALVCLKSGDVKGESEMAFKLRLADGKTVEVPKKFPVVLNGGIHGANFKMALAVPVVYGLNWLDVYWNGNHLSAVPFKLEKTPAPQAAQQ